MKMSFVNTRPTVVTGQDEQKTKYNYIIGNDCSKWFSNVPSFSEVVARQPYDGVSIRYSIDQGAPRYDVVVEPGADPTQVGIKIDGADATRILPNGNLEFQTSLGPVQERGLTAYQDTPSGRAQVPCRMQLDHGVLHFDTGAYDANKPLVIDPLIFATYLDGTGASTTDIPEGIALDSSGNKVVAGLAESTDFPTTTGAIQSTDNNPYGTAFVAKLSADGTALLSSTYLGGHGQNGSDNVNAVTLDSLNNIYLAGTTASTDFPTTAGAFQTTSGNSKSTGFVTELNPDETALVFSTYLGGNGASYPDVCNAIALDAFGNIAVTGATGSSNFPTTSGAYQTTMSSAIATFVSKLNSTGTALVASTYLAGPGARSETAANGIATDSSGKHVCLRGRFWQRPTHNA